jgi:Family of unknown function (DUF6256)
MKAAGVASGEVLRHIVAPTAFVFLLVVAMLVVIGATWSRPSRRDTERGDLGLGGLARFLLVTAVAGYVVFLGIVAVFHVVIGGGPVSVIGDAASGGALLAFGIAVPVFVGLAAVTRWRSR